MGATIRDHDEKSKSLTRRIFENRELFPAILIVVVGVASFGLGRLSVVVPKGQVASSSQVAQVGSSHSPEEQVGPTSAQKVRQVEKNTGTPQTGNKTTAVSPNAGTNSAVAPQTSTGEKTYVGSKNSNKYHLPWCSGAARIAEENKVWFASKEEAAEAGYIPATNCKGI